MEMGETAGHAFSDSFDKDASKVSSDLFLHPKIEGPSVTVNTTKCQECGREVSDDDVIMAPLLNTYKRNRWGSVCKGCMEKRRKENTEYGEKGKKEKAEREAKRTVKTIENLEPVNELRPLTFDDFIGQVDSIKKIRIAIDSVKARNQPLGHILINGPAGTGKTTLVQIIANELGVDVISTIGNNIQKDTDVLDLVRRCSKRNSVNILFIDEIHTIAPRAQNNLLTCLEDRTITVKQGNHSQRFGFTPITIIGATTDPGGLLNPVYDRFLYKLVLDLYTISELKEVVKFCISKLDFVESITDEAALEVARRSKGVPRIAINLCSTTIREVAIKNNKKEIDIGITEEAFDVLDLDENGLYTKTDIKILKHLFSIYPQTVGLNSMAQFTYEDPRHIEKIVEPELYRLGYIHRLKTGRQITPRGVEYLKKKGFVSDEDMESSVVALD